MRKRLNRIVTARLNKEGAQYLTPENEWKAIFPEIPITTDENHIKVRFSKKEGNDAINLSYPFTITKTTAYVYGLALGSAVKKKDRLTLKIDPRQLTKVENFCRQFQLKPKVKVIKKRQKQREKERYTRYFQDAIVKIPTPIFYYLKALGFDGYRPRIPDYFHPNLKHQVIAGYLNSKRATMVHHGTLPLNQWLKLTASSEQAFLDHAKKFTQQIIKDFKYHGIQAEVKEGDYHSEIIVKNREVAKIVKHYRIRRPQIRYSAKLVGLMNDLPHIRTMVNAYGLDAFQLTVLEIAFYYFFKLGRKEIEYSRIDELLCVGSNTIRQCLYDFQELGLVQYFAKGKKEFLRPTFLCFKNTEDLFKEKVDSFKEPMQKGEGVAFECLDCGLGVSYSSAMETGGFNCPHCGSSELQCLSESELRRHLAAWNREYLHFHESYEVMCIA